MSFVMREFESSDFDRLYEFVHAMIDRVYPGYYPKSAVDFFHRHHSIENMREDISRGLTFIVENSGKIIGTGSIVDYEIKRMFVDTSVQRHGIGSGLLDALEKDARRRRVELVKLCSSLPSFHFYQKNGYEFVKYKIEPVLNDQFLCYFIMVKNMSC